jgi:hypothetical protein
VGKDDFDRLPTDFIAERKYLHNVTKKTLVWYNCSFRAFENCITEADYKNRIVQLRERGVSAISVNTYLRCINAYLNWKGASFKLHRLKEEQKILTTLSADSIRSLINWKPEGLTKSALTLLRLRFLIPDFE